MRSNPFGFATPQQRRQADLFYESLMGTRVPRLARRPRAYEAYAEQPAATAQQPYLPTGGRNFVPQQGTFVFTCAPTPFVVIPASFLPERTTNADAAIDSALTASGLNATQRGQVERAGLRPIAAEFGGAALTELFARLRWSAADVVTFDRRRNLLAPRLLIHIPGHFRELARRAPDAREAFVLECLGWLLMAKLRSVVASAMRTTLWIPPAPPFVTAVPNPVPAVSDGVRALLMRYLMIDTAMTADQWNARLVAWGSGLAGRQWQAEVSAPQPGRPFYAGLATIPAHVNTATERAALRRAWDLRVGEVDARHAPDAPGAAAVTLAGLRNAAELRTCINSPHLPARIVTPLTLPPGLVFAEDFPTGNTLFSSVGLMTQLHPAFTALFTAIRDLGWNDLLYQCGGGACFRGTKHTAVATVTIDGRAVSIDPFNSPDATKVTRINTHFTPQQRAKVVRAEQAARRMSNHAAGAAIDFNTFENDQGVGARPLGSMDPRLVAIFEAFHFNFGACFTPTDPMHFDYCERPCAPASAAAGTLGPVVTRRMLMPMRATDRVLA